MRMINVSEWPDVMKLTLLLAPFAIGLVGLAIKLHIAATQHFNVMCEALHRSSGLHEELRNGGAFTLKLRLSTVSAMTAGIICPRLGIRQGWLDAEDSRLFPPYLKKRMKLGFYCISVSLACMAFLYLFVNFDRA